MRTIWWYARKWRHNDVLKSQKIELDNLKNPAKNRLSSESEGARHGTGPMGEKVEMRNMSLFYPSTDTDHAEKRKRKTTGEEVLAILSNRELPVLVVLDVVVVRQMP